MDDGDDEYVSGKGSKNGGKGKVGEGTNKHSKKYHKRSGDHTLEPCKFIFGPLVTFRLITSTSNIPVKRSPRFVTFEFSM